MPRNLTTLSSRRETARAESLVEVLLDDIVQHPEQTHLWGVMADYLEDHADPRAELVRLTWSLQYEPAHADFATRQARVQALLAGGMVPVRPRRTLGGIEFAWIPPGAFLMGSPESEEGRNSDETQHRVTLTQGFWMGVHPVTQGQWLALTGENPSRFSRQGDGEEAVRQVSDGELARFPVECVSWEDAEVFCQRLSESLGQRVRLPTEAQWEYACRAGTTTPFHFGAILSGTQANCDGHHPCGTDEQGPYLGQPTPVGLASYPANAWGLTDLHGNVCEWCADAYQEDYENLPPTDPSNVGTGDSRRVLRGGSWDFDSWLCRSADRGGNAPVRRSCCYGFRVVVALP